MNEETSKPQATLPLVAVVDDDESVRESLPPLLRSCQLDVCEFSSAHDFLSSPTGMAADCLILDIGLLGMSGFELQDELTRRGIAIPIVFITARVDRAERARTMQREADDCLVKPFNVEALLSAVDKALKRR